MLLRSVGADPNGSYPLMKRGNRGWLSWEPGGLRLLEHGVFGGRTGTSEPGRPSKNASGPSCLLPQPGGFEGFGRVRKEARVDDLLIPYDPDPANRDIKQIRAALKRLRIS
jgi:hypothetical protein